MEASGAPSEDVLLQRPWLPVSISGCHLLAKSWFGETAYRILLTDTHCVWEERMDAADIQSRARELNRRLRASVEAFFSHLREVAQPCLAGGGGDAQVSLKRQQDGGISVRLKSELAGLPFHWEFHCKPAPVALVCLQLVRPLLVMSRLLQQQVEQLGRLMVRKDAEIQDYKENGATLSRERLQTDAFEEQTYRESFMAEVWNFSSMVLPQVEEFQYLGVLFTVRDEWSGRLTADRCSVCSVALHRPVAVKKELSQKTLPLLWSESSDALGFGAELQQLYATAVSHRNARKRKVSEEWRVEEKPPAAEDLALASSPEDGSVSTDPAGEDRKQNLSEQVEASRATKQQPPPVMSDPAERSTSKPKKKKKGLFR